MNEEIKKKCEEDVKEMLKDAKRNLEMSYWLIGNMKLTTYAHTMDLIDEVDYWLENVKERVKKNEHTPIKDTFQQAGKAV